MGKRCIVPGCTSATEAKKFSSDVKKYGHAHCPLHLVDSTQCKCSWTIDVFSYHSFPKSPGLRQLWFLLLGLNENYRPLTSESVCSKHFELGKNFARQKVPILHIGRPDDEIQKILRRHASAVIDEQAIVGMSSPPSKYINAHLADATAAAIFSLETTQNLGKSRGSVREEFMEDFGEFFPHIFT